MICVRLFTCYIVVGFLLCFSVGCFNRSVEQVDKPPVVQQMNIQQDTAAEPDDMNK